MELFQRIVPDYASLLARIYHATSRHPQHVVLSVDENV